MAAKPQPLEVGTKAPAFTATTFDGQKVRLSEYKGTKVVLYFYPKDATPGCTKQACNLRDTFKALVQAGTAVIGCSPDGTESHENFPTKHGRPFPLFADPSTRSSTSTACGARSRTMARPTWGYNAPRS